MKTDDRLKKFAGKASNEEALSPMEPPEAFAQSTVEPVAYEDMHPFLQKLMDEHKAFVKVLDNFEAAMDEWKRNNWKFNESINRNFKGLFSFLDNSTPVHNKKEEKQLFPILHKNFLKTVNTTEMKYQKPVWISWSTSIYRWHNWEHFV
jgi:DUF438 domain-containing protein